MYSIKKMENSAFQETILIVNRNLSERPLLKQLCSRKASLFTAFDSKEAVSLLSSRDVHVLVVESAQAAYSHLKGILPPSTSLFITGKEEASIKNIIKEWPQEYYIDFMLFPFPEKKNESFLLAIKRALEYATLRKEIDILRQSSRHSDNSKLKEAFSEIQEIKDFIRSSVLKEQEKRLEAEARYLGFRKKKWKIEDILKKLYIANDVSKLLDIVYDIKDIIQAESISFYLLDESETLGKYLKPLVWDDAFLSHPDFMKHVVSLGAQDFAASVARSGSEINIAHIASEKRFSSRYTKQLKSPLQSLMSIPIMHDKDVIGVLEVYNKRLNGGLSPEGFTGSDQQVMRKLSEHISIAIQKLNLIQYDALTGLLRPDPFFENIIQKLKLESKRREEKGFYALVMGDVDWFKNYNDRNGHEAGNKLLRELSSVLKLSIRDEDLLCRYGGEEFLFFLTGIKDNHEAYIFTERIRKNVEEHFFPHQEFQPQNNLTMSFGIATFSREGFESLNSINKNSLKKITNEADIAMRKAKGKNASSDDVKEGPHTLPTKNKICIYSENAEELKKVPPLHASPETSGHDKRKFQRFNTSNILIFKKLSGHAVTKTVNMSLGGAKISTDTKLPYDEMLDMILVLGNKAFPCKGEVRYSEKVIENIPYYFSGIQFKDLSFKNKQILEEYFSSLSLNRSSSFH